MSQYETPVIVDGNNSETIEPQASHQGVDLDIFDKKIVLSPGGGYKVF